MNTQRTHSVEPLQELPVAPGGERRRWFQSPDGELLVWLLADGSMEGFQLTVGPRPGRCLTWLTHRGFAYDLVEPGDERTSRDSVAVLIPTRGFPRDDFNARFLALSGELERPIRLFVEQKILECPL